ncbi:MAG: hypothetical protein HY426_03235, partial [Candidatus Levybacteria bacterium]|nr:hypothetical protein [Candidatus Levybacteria bacterium]
ASILNEIGVFNKVYNQELQKDNLPLKKIIIVLTNGKQLKEYKDAAGNVAFSYNFEFLKDYVIFYIHLPEDVISDSSASQMFGASVIYIASKLEESGKPVNIPKEEFDNYYKSAGGLFQIEQRNSANSTLPPEIQMLLSPTPTPTPTR